MRVLIAGATGVIGRQAVPILIEAGHEVVALSRAPADVPGASTVVADALDAAALAGAVRSASPEVVVHLMTAIPDPIDPRHMARDMAMTNRLRTEGTANLIAAAGNARVIAQSLAYAYDPNGLHRWGSRLRDEDAPLWLDPPKQFRPVVQALTDLERQVTAVGGTVLRFGHLYGPGSSYAADGGFTDLVRRRKVPIVGAGNSIFSFTHAYDAATAILAAVEQPVSDVFNVVDDDPAPIHSWLVAMAAMTGAPAPTKISPWLARMAVGGWGLAFMTRLVGASNGRAREVLDWKPRYTSWRDGFAEELS